MSLESLLFTSLTGNSGLRSLISARLYPDVLPQGATLPAVVYQRISTPRQHTFGAGCPVAVSRPRLQYACWATTPAAALAVCEALRSALQASGSLRADLDPALVAALVIAASDGLQTQWLLDASVDHEAALALLDRLLAPPAV